MTALPRPPCCAPSGMRRRTINRNDDDTGRNARHEYCGHLSAAALAAIVLIAAACSGTRTQSGTGSTTANPDRMTIRLSAASPSRVDRPVAAASTITLEAAPPVVFKACRTAAANQSFRILCPTALPYPAVGWPPGSLPPPMYVALQNDSREFEINVSYGAPWEQASGTDWKQHLWRNRPCCFVHFVLSVQRVGERGGPSANAQQMMLGGRTGRLELANGRGSYFGNHLRFFFADSGTHWVASLHSFGAGTEQLLKFLVAGLQPVRSAAAHARNGIPVGSGAAAIALTSDAVWVATQGDAVRSVPGEIIRIDRSTRRVVARIPVGRPQALAAGVGSIWVATVRPRGAALIRIDTETNRISDVVALHDRKYQAAVAIAGNRVWTVNLSGTVSELDGATGRLLKQLTLTGAPDGVAVANGSVWISKYLDDSVVRINAGTGRVIAVVRVGRGPRGILALSGSIWVANVDGQTLSVIDTATNRVIATVPIGGSPYGLAHVRGFIVVADMAAGRLYRIDPSTRAIKRLPRSIEGDPVALVGDNDQIWIARNTVGDVLRLGAADLGLR